MLPIVPLPPLLANSDPLIFDALAGEGNRQQHQIEMIASENIVSDAVRAALGHQITNKTLEGYPGKRFHGGAEYADIIEQEAIDRARRLFDCGYANVQPHSGSQANLAVFFSILQPADRVLSLDLAAGGHLSHGAPANLSGRWFDAHHYGVDPHSGLIDYEQLQTMIGRVKPKLLVAGGSAYPRQLDFERLGAMARAEGCTLLVDMAHIAGLVAGGVHPSPLPHADIATCTTTKTLRGPRGGMILSRDQQWESKLQSAVFPGVQGSLHTNVIAAKAVCLGEALQPEFAQYAQKVVDNARVLAEVLRQRGIKLVGDGTDTHLLLLDLSHFDINGQWLQDALSEVNITSNKNPVPFDSPRPAEWQGLRLGTAAVTSRGLGEAQMQQLGGVISDIVEFSASAENTRITQHKELIAAICRDFPGDHHPASQ